VPADLDEPQLTQQQSDPVQIAESLACFKARQVAVRYPHAVVLGADTVVSLGDKIFGKPFDAQHARQILSTLAGTEHKVITGVAIICQARSKEVVTSASTVIRMKPISEQGLDEHIRGGTWAGKAGAYAIQQGADAYIEHIEGSFSNVVGVPMELTQRLLEQFDILPDTNTVSEKS